MSKQRRAQSALLPVSPLLMTESEDEFDRVRDAFDQELKPRGIVEQMYVADIAYLAWEILRLRRCKAAIINSALVLPWITSSAAFAKARRYPIRRGKAQKLAHVWFSDPTAKRQVSELLSDFQLDESAIEAEAIRSSAKTLSRSKGCWHRWSRVATRHCVASPTIAAASRDSCARAATGSSMAKSSRWKRPPAKSHRQPPDRGKRTANCSEPSQRAQEHRSSFQRRQETDEPKFLPSRSYREPDLKRRTHQTH